VRLPGQEAFEFTESLALDHRQRLVIDGCFVEHAPPFVITYRLKPIQQGFCRIEIAGFEQAIVFTKEFFGLHIRSLARSVADSGETRTGHPLRGGPSSSQVAVGCYLPMVNGVRLPAGRYPVSPR